MPQPGDGDEYLVLTGIYLAFADTENGRLDNLKETWVRELPSSEPGNGRCFALEKAGTEEGVWFMRGYIDCPSSTDTLRFALKNKNNVEVDAILLEVNEPDEDSVIDSAFEAPMGSGRMVTRYEESVWGSFLAFKFIEISVKFGELAHLLWKLADLENSRFEDSGNHSHIAEVISLQKRALDLTPDPHPDRAGRLAGLGASFYARFQRFGALADLNEAISLDQRALDSTPEGHHALANRLASLGVSFYTRSQSTGALSDLKKAISLIKRALNITPDDDPDLPHRLSGLAACYHARFQNIGEMIDLDKAISLKRRALENIPKGHPVLADTLANLGLSLYSRFQRTGVLADLEEAISLDERALGLTLEGDPDLARRLSGLGACLHARFKRIGELADLDKAILLEQKAVEITPGDHPGLAQMLASLGSSFYSRFQRKGALADLEEAISLDARALDITPEGHPDRPRRLSGLGVSYHARFERLGELADLDKAISWKRKALEKTPDGHPSLADMLLSVGFSLSGRFQRLGELADLNEAIFLGQRALECTPEDHPGLAHRLASLGAVFHARFERTRELGDITEAIMLERRALELTADDHPELAHTLANLGASYYTRFQHAGDVDDLDEAISLDQRALDVTPDGHPDLANRFGNLGASLYSRFQRLGKMDDLDKALSLDRKALNSTPEGNPHRAHRLANLAANFYARFSHNSDIADLSEAITLSQDALEKMPPEHPIYPTLSLYLGYYFASKYNMQGGVAEDISAAISHANSAATSIHGQHSVRLRAAKFWAQNLQLHFPQSPDLLQAYGTALSVVAEVADLGRTIQHRYSTLEEGSGVALDAASAALAAERVEKALEWLEQGRCLVWGQLTHLRAPLDELRSRDNALADEIISVSELLDAAGSSRLHSHHGKSLAEKMSLEDEGRRHSDLVRKRDELIARARALPGFDTLFLPPSLSTLQRGLPPAGYVVVISAHEGRCDALVLSAEREDVLHVPLRAFSLAKARAHRSALMQSFERHGLRVRQGDQKDEDIETRGIRIAQSVKNPVTVLLKGLWTDVVKPIFDAIGLEKHDPASGSPCPRVWWCPTGVLSFLPIHAAGLYDDAKQPALSALDYAIPSYTPTINSLADRVRKSRPVSKGVSGLLLTSQPSPGPTIAPSIPGTTREAQSLYARACEEKIRALKLEGGEVTIDAYLDQMERFSSVHLACHGSQKADDPLASRFLFHDGSLELRAIIKKNLDNADLAFLSACQTSTGDEKLADEAVHLAAGMLAAGYRRVVATMWSIGDNEAPQVAQDFYDYIFDRKEEGDVGGFDGSHSAEALHYAIQRLRSRLDNSDRSLLAWAPYVHWGY